MILCDPRPQHLALSSAIFLALVPGPDGVWGADRRHLLQRTQASNVGRVSSIVSVWCSMVWPFDALILFSFGYLPLLMQNCL